jgi:hypothetical protein
LECFDELNLVKHPAQDSRCSLRMLRFNAFHLTVVDRRRRQIGCLQSAQLQQEQLLNRVRVSTESGPTNSGGDYHARRFWTSKVPSIIFIIKRHQMATRFTTCLPAMRHRPLHPISLVLRYLKRLPSHSPKNGDGPISRAEQRGGIKALGNV